MKQNPKLSADPTSPTQGMLLGSPGIRTGKQGCGTQGWGRRPAGGPSQGMHAFQKHPWTIPISRSFEPGVGRRGAMGETSEQVQDNGMHAGTENHVQNAPGAQWRGQVVLCIGT